MANKPSIVGESELLFIHKPVVLRRRRTGPEPRVTRDERTLRNRKRCFHRSAGVAVGGQRVVHAAQLSQRHVDTDTRGVVCTDSNFGKSRIQHIRRPPCAPSIKIMINR